jgi:hypothetical protein
MKLAVAGGSGPGPRTIEMGRCSRCGVICVGPRGQRRKLVSLLRAHEAICPGGKRKGEVWAPLDVLSLDGKER